MADSDNPLEAFRQVLTGASRAIAQEPELELGFTAELPSTSGKSVKVPMPSRTLPERDVAGRMAALGAEPPARYSASYDRFRRRNGHRRTERPAADATVRRGCSKGCLLCGRTERAWPER